MTRFQAAAAFAAFMALGALAACSSARRGEPLQDPLDVSDPRLARGEGVFMAQCNKCHPGGGAGLGPALNNKSLPAFFVHYQIRNGIGAMPAFDPDDLPEQDLEDVAAYLKALRRYGTGNGSGKQAGKEGAAERVTAESQQDAPDIR